MERAIQDYITYLRNVKRASHNTEVSYERDLKNAARYFKREDKFSPDKITPSDLISYIEWMEDEKLSNSTVSRRVAALRSFFRYLKQEERIESNPTEKLKRPKVEKKPPKTLSPEETEKLLSQPDKQTLKGLRDWAMLELLCATGIRVSELVGLQMNDIEMRRRYLICRRHSKECRIPFGDSAKKALSMYFSHARGVFLKGKESSFVFTNCSGGAMSRQGFWKILKKYASDAGISKEITPNTLRHSFAIHLIRDGVDLKNVQEMLGHSYISTTAAYADLDLLSLKEI